MSLICQRSLASAAAMFLVLTGCQQGSADSANDPSAPDAGQPADPAPAPEPAGVPPASEASAATEESSGNAGLCTSGEEVIFSCQLENKKVASVCGAKNNAGKIIAQYRYGKVGASPELAWPDLNTKDQLTFASVPYSGGGEAQLQFTRGGNQYIVFSRVVRTNFTAGEPNDPAIEDGVVVRKGDKNIARHFCSGPDTKPISSEKAARYAGSADGELVYWEN